MLFKIFDCQKSFDRNHLKNTRPTNSGFLSITYFLHVVLISIHYSKVVVEGPMDHISSQLLRAQRDRPRSLHLQVSRILAANYRSIETGSRHE